MITGNPNHPVVKEMEGNWHKLAAILMLKFGVRNLEILPEDVRLMTEGMGIVADTRDGKFFLRVVTREEGDALAREHGGMAM